MLSFLDPVRGMDPVSVLLRLVLSVLCGTVIGLERSMKNRPAGFRTHILVCLGAAMAAMTGLYLVLEMQLPADVSRISAQVISGLGFIGAGAIVITKKLAIKGLTTSAGLWTCGIIGLALGSGYYELGVIGTLLVLLAETWFAVLGGSIIKKNPEYILEVCYDEKTSLDNVLRFCKDSHMAIINLKIHTREETDEEKRGRYIADVSLRGNTSCETLLTQIRRMSGIISAIGM